MKRICLLLVLVCTFFASGTHVYAADDPLRVPNNKFGVHILFPSELKDAAKLVNSNGGDWGYVTIPIQSGDKNIQKWQAFMDQAKQAHLIPLIRLATEGDFFNTSVWRKPTTLDIVDFANFLDSLNWPTKNRYIIVYNEPNRGDEWGGKPDPAEYADILSYAVTAFKSKNTDYFIISAGLDNAAANTASSMNEYTFIYQMNQAVPGIFNQIDGLGSHSYPNPAFSQSPLLITNENIMSFRYESSLVAQFSSKQLPVFITETGWTKDELSQQTIADYFQVAFSQVWNDSNVVVVTPFVLEAGGGPFKQFSLLSAGGSDTIISKAIQSIAKVKGEPAVAASVLAAEQSLVTTTLPLKRFVSQTTTKNSYDFFTKPFKELAKFLLHV